MNSSGAGLNFLPSNLLERRVEVEEAPFLQSSFW